MRETHISLPELALVAGTRAAAGMGLGLLLADKFAPSSRRAMGWTLLLVGAISTIPLLMDVCAKSEEKTKDVEVPAL